MNKPFMWNWQWRFLNVYSYARTKLRPEDYGFYWVDVPERAQRGFGFQVRIKDRDVGFSVTWEDLFDC